MKQYSNALINGGDAIEFHANKPAESLGAKRHHFTLSSNASMVQSSINVSCSRDKNHRP